MFQIDIKSRTPIYEQVILGFMRSIISGETAEGEKIPTVRECAGRLRINPNTVQKAYKILEERGYFQTVAGRGSFASAPPPEELARERAAIYAKIHENIKQLLFFGESHENITNFTNQIGGTHDKSE